MNGQLCFAGALTTRRVRSASLWQRLRNIPYIWSGLWRAWLARLCGMSHIEGRLYMRHVRADGSIVDRGLVGTQKVTVAFANLLVDALQGHTTDLAAFCYHDCGSGTSAEQVGDTALQHPLGLARAAGTQTKGAEQHVYVSVATITFDNKYTITEHGVFNAPTGGVLLDRTVFAPVSVLSTERIEFTYMLRVIAGG